MTSALKVSFSECNFNLKEVLDIVLKKNAVTHVNLFTYPTKKRTVSELPHDDYPRDPRENAQYPSEDEVEENSSYTKPILYPTNDFLTQELPVPGLGKNTALGLCSLVRLESSLPAHLFQLDIDKEYTFKNGLVSLNGLLNTSLEAGLNKDTKFYLMNSGSGIHVYADALLTLDNWKRWITNLEVLNLDVDPGWTRLSNARGYSVLRLSSNEDRPLIPTPFLQARFID